MTLRSAEHSVIRHSTERTNTNQHYDYLRDSLVEVSLGRYGKLMCGICNQEIVDNGRKYSQCNWNIDHIVPVSKGGEDTLENTQLAHRECNHKKAHQLPDGMS